MAPEGGCAVLVCTGQMGVDLLPKPIGPSSVRTSLTEEDVGVGELELPQVTPAMSGWLLCNFRRVGCPLGRFQRAAGKCL